MGSGKSTVASRLRELGATVVDADRLARAAVARGSDGLQQVVERFGPGVLEPTGDLDRQALGRIVFQDPEARKALEAIVHPEVSRLADEAAEAALRSGAPLFVYDVPLLFENGLEGQFDRVVVVAASLENRRQRLAERDRRLSSEEIDARIGSQMPLEDKLRRADHVIDNDGRLGATLAQVDALHAALLAMAKVPAP